MLYQISKKIRQNLYYFLSAGYFPQDEKKVNITQNTTETHKKFANFEYIDRLEKSVIINFKGLPYLWDLSEKT